MIATLTIWFLVGGLVVGQLIRFPLPGQSGGVLVSDVAVVLVLLVACSRYCVSGRREIAHTLYLLLYTPFILWSLFTLVIHAGDYPTDHLLIAGSYWLRTSCYLLLIPALLYLARDRHVSRALRQGLVVLICTLAVSGFLQVIFFANLADLPSWLLTFAGSGWDPHEGRLVATWLDPNFFGAFINIALLYMAGQFFSTSSKPQKIFFLAMLAALAVAGILTESRSSFIALGVALIVLSPVILLRVVHERPRTVLPAVIGIMGIIIVSTSLAAVALGDRLVGLLTYDPTVEARATSLAAVWPLAQEYSFVGVGYNAFQFAALDAGVINDFSLHSRAGADNSWLTLAVTTGLLGVALFALPWCVMGVQLARRWLVDGHVLAITAAASVLMLATHSQFINSFLYAHLLVALAIAVALAYQTHDQVL